MMPRVLPDISIPVKDFRSHLPCEKDCTDDKWEKWVQINKNTQHVPFCQPSMSVKCKCLIGIEKTKSHEGVANKNSPPSRTCLQRGCCVPRSTATTSPTEQCSLCCRRVCSSPSCRACKCDWDAMLEERIKKERTKQSVWQNAGQKRHNTHYKQSYTIQHTWWLLSRRCCQSPRQHDQWCASSLQLEWSREWPERTEKKNDHEVHFNKEITEASFYDYKNNLCGTANHQGIVFSNDFDQLGFRHGFLKVNIMSSLLEDVDANLCKKQIKSSHLYPLSVHYEWYLINTICCEDSGMRRRRRLIGSSCQGSYFASNSLHSTKAHTIEYQMKQWLAGIIVLEEALLRWIWCKNGSNATFEISCALGIAATNMRLIPSKKF